MSLDGKSALITGGGSGIGAAIALALAGEGARVMIAGRNLEKLERCATQGTIIPCVCDVADRVAATALAEEAIAQFGHVDILVNAAGVNVPNRLMENLDPADWDRLMQINATGTFNTIQALLPSMKARQDGLIININSTSGLRAGMLGGVAYNASKFAVTALSHSVAQEVQDAGIRVTNLCPGEVETPILAQRPKPVTAEHLARILQPSDVADLVVAIAALPPRANVPEVIIKPTTQTFV